MCCQNIICQYVWLSSTSSGQMWFHSEPNNYAFYCHISYTVSLIWVLSIFVTFHWKLYNFSSQYFKSSKRKKPSQHQVWKILFLTVNFHWSYKILTKNHLHSLSFMSLCTVIPCPTCPTTFVTNRKKRNIKSQSGHIQLLDTLMGQLLKVCAIYFEKSNAIGKLAQMSAPASNHISFFITCHKLSSDVHFEARF